MNIEALGQALLDASWRTGWIVVALVLLRPLLLRWMLARFLFLGWVIVACHLLVPMGISFPWSLPGVETAFAAAPEDVENNLTATFETPAKRAVGTGAVSTVAETMSQAPSVATVALVVWGVGVVVFLVMAVAGGVRNRRRFAAAREVREGVLFRCAAEAATALGTRKSPCIYEVDTVETPAIVGIFAPRILFPRNFAGKFSEAELRLMIFHELGHWVRRDVAAMALLQAARALHWFNPLVWIAVRLARHDCELACDEFVMRRASSAERHAYGATLLKVLGVVCGQKRSPQVLGILESKQQLKRRIQMIVNYRTSTLGRTVAGVALVAALTLVVVARNARADGGKIEESHGTPGEITSVTPVPWFKNGSKTDAYVVGSDPTQPHMKPVSAYIKSLKPEIDGFGGMMQSFSAEDYRGKRVRFSAWVKSKDVAGTANVWMRIDGKGESQRSLQFDNMNGREVKGTSGWARHSVVLDVPQEAEAISLGFFISGTGQAWFNDSQFEVVSFDVPSTNLKTDLSQARARAPRNLDFDGAGEE